MRRRYYAAFHVGKAGNSGPNIEDISQACLDWVLDSGRVRLPEGTTIAPCEEVPRTGVGDGSWIETIFGERADSFNWGLRFVHPDPDPHVEWLTEVCASQDVETGRTSFSCANLVGSAAGFVVPTFRDPSRPRIVRDLIKKWGAYRGLDLTETATILDADGVAQFVEWLRSQERVRPVVFVSATNREDRPIIDADQIAGQVCGLAHVFVGRDRFPSLDLKRHLPQALNCWDGSVRVYWPGMGLADESFRHRFWRPDEIREIEHTRRRGGFASYLLGFLSNVAAFTTDPAALSWEDLRAIRRERMIADARKAGNQDELLDLAEEEIREKTQKIKETEAERDEIARQLQEAESRERQWKAAYLEQCKQSGGSSEAEVSVPLETVADALDRAEPIFRDKLVFALNSRSDEKKSLFERPNEVYAALEFLATTYFEARMGRTPCDDFDIALREINGWSYEAGQSEVTMGKYKDWYRTRWDGRSYDLPEHVGTGSGKDPRRTIRIGFNWDRERSKVVVGYVGQHQQTDAS